MDWIAVELLSIGLFGGVTIIAVLALASRCPAEGDSGARREKGWPTLPLADFRGTDGLSAHATSLRQAVERNRKAAAEPRPDKRGIS